MLTPPRQHSLTAFSFGSILHSRKNVTRSEVKWSEVAQSRPTLCDPMGCSLKGSSVHGIFQARILEWVAISFSNVTGGWPQTPLEPVLESPDTSPDDLKAPSERRTTTSLSSALFSTLKGLDFFQLPRKGVRLWRALAGCGTLSVQFSRSVLSDSLWAHGLHQARLPCPSPNPRVYSKSCPLSQLSHPLSSPSPPIFNLSQHQGLFKSVNSSHQVAKGLEFQL